MKPKKKSLFPLIIYGLFLIFTVYISIHAASAYSHTDKLISKGKIEESGRMPAFTTELSNRLTKKPFDFKKNKYTETSLIYGGLLWLIIVLCLESNKKNFIHGKEFGTAKWGGKSDISDLFADNIAKLEIERAKRLKTKIGRWLVKRKIFKECEKSGEILKKVKLENLKEREEELKQNGGYNKEAHNEAVRLIKEETDKEIVDAKKQAWKPYLLKCNYNDYINEIDENPLYNNSEKEERKLRAKAEYKKSLDMFYDTDKRISSIKKKYKDADMLLTKSERISIYNWKLNNNTLILGGSGSGKTRGYVMPNILQAHSSFIVTDPKGEILEKAGYFLSEIKGYKIHVLNLDEKTMSDGYNPFTYIHPEREGYEERILSLIETIIINTDGGEKKGGSELFWDKAERLFLQAVFFFTCDGFIEEERTMNTVMELIAMLQIAEDEDNYDSDLDYFAQIFERRHGSEHIGVKQWKEFRQKASGKTAKSIVISAVARLAPFRTSAVRKIFSYDSMHLDMVGEEKTAIFVVVPPTDTTFNFIAGMLFTQLFQELQYCATQKHKHDGQKLPVPCRFILDEFANTCKIPNFVKILAYARSFGIGIVPILQSLEQIKNMYKDEWGVIVDNCNELLYLGSITHKDTLEYMSFLLGKGTFDKKTTGRTRGKQGSSSENFDVVGRELMTPDEIRKLDKAHCLLVIGGRNPFFSEKYDYTKHPNYGFTSDANASYSYHYEPCEFNFTSESRPHGEDETIENIPKEINIYEGMEEDTVLIEDPDELLKIMTEKFSEMDVISNELLSGEELTPEQEQLFLDMLIKDDKENEEASRKIMEASAEVVDYIKNIEEQLPKLEEDPVKILREVIKLSNELEPVSFDGSLENTPEVQEIINEIINDNDFIEEEDSSIAELINNDPLFKELLEEAI